MPEMLFPITSSSTWINVGFVRRAPLLKRGLDNNGMHDLHGGPKKGYPKNFLSGFDMRR